MKDEPFEITTEILLRAYTLGIFPMSESRDQHEIFWVDPKRRGILPIERFHISRSLRRKILKNPFRITFDKAFTQVISGCADRQETWINTKIASLYEGLFDQGHAHSIEVWNDDRLVGGVYGVAIGAAFFGESMFSRQTDASKIALAYLTHRLWKDGFTLFDTQFITDHLLSLGAEEISKSDYHKRLDAAVIRHALFRANAPLPSPYEITQPRTQTS
ncbi:leucyl/phenylalanyl-tRNA--protein transferase [Pelagovum sp. HNIBRBA483]|uniref:leucyl/phenylalanyl-tRNA--protein transferase n=1 Tax=Pelagovum sp. HNIBRBA483 TaxID=3233341 RepID=UPI0034A13274